MLQYVDRPREFLFVGPCNPWTESVGLHNFMIAYCKICGKEFKTCNAVILEGNGKFCSRKCYGDYQSINRRGENHHNWKGGDVELTCVWCGVKYIRPRKSIGNGRGKFCSISCYAKWQSKYRVGSLIPSWKGGLINVSCEICGLVFKIAPSRDKHRKVRFCSSKCWGIWKSKNMVGKNCPSWKGGITKLNYSIRVSKEYILWRNKIFKRDMYICQKCGQIGGKLNAHHILPFRSHPDKRLDINNGITLCKSCHKEEHKSCKH